MGKLPILQGRLLALCLFLWPIAATAQTQCQGRYATASQMLDAAYGRFGTLYTGGPSASYFGTDLGPTIDLYRLWRGLPDLRFRDAQGFDPTGDWGRDYGGFGIAPDDLTLKLRIATRPQAGNRCRICRPSRAGVPPFAAQAQAARCFATGRSAQRNARPCHVQSGDDRRPRSDDLRRQGSPRKSGLDQHP